MSDFVPFESPFLKFSTLSTAASSTLKSNTEATQPTGHQETPSVTPVEISDIILIVKIRYNYDEIRQFIDELRHPNENLLRGDQKLSVFQLYTLYMLDDPIDMSSQTERKVYRPKLFVRKNDKFSPFNFYFLLNLFDIEYKLGGTDDADFPTVWKTTFETKVTVNVIPWNRKEARKTSTELDADENTARNLLDVFKIICREQKYDESYATEWKKKFEDEQINTLDHLRSISNDSWEKLTKIPEVAKQLIKDYIQINFDAAANLFSQQLNDPYQDSKATLLADIHRVRRYFYYVIKKIDSIPYLLRNVVDLAIEEVKKTYDDDGNILINIQNYLYTFCLEKRSEDAITHEKKKKNWQLELEELRNSQLKDNEKISQLQHQSKQLGEKMKLYEKRRDNKVNLMSEKELALKIKAKLSEKTTGDADRLRKENEAKKIKSDYDLEKVQADATLKKLKDEYKRKTDEYLDLDAKVASDKVQIEHLENLMKMDWKEQEKKLRVKYGRGLLLFGPPGTGKSELLKRIAVYAGITMITQPLSAGELNRPFVGETEKLLVDIMYRAHTIPYLICAMTIDEIDGLVPKRDNNAQQSKVDGISVLLSHIEGVKNIPNLIVFGATNRRNMMDEAILRRMQAKVFVGRPSPTTRKNMLNPLIYISNTFTSKRIDALVRITTNFSGAAVGALRSNIIVEMDRNPDINDRRLLELADTVAREFNIWFGISTLPTICRLNSSIFDSKIVSKDNDKFSLAFRDELPSGRILIDLQNRKCLIELQGDETTLERDLDVKETSIQTLLARLIQGCFTRNIDTVQVIDLNFLTKQNATEENQIFEVLTTIFLECDEYNKSMLVFDIDSLIMLNKSDSEMSKSTSLSNVRLYQFIREKCKIAIVEQENKNEQQRQTANKADAKPVEKWIVMIVKDEYLRTNLINDIEFKKTAVQLDEWAKEEEKRLDDERPRKCPKCFHDFIPKDTKFGDCHYHDGFIVDCEKPQEHLTADRARAIMQHVAMLREEEENKPLKTPFPKFLWACCGQRYSDNQMGCRTSSCGLPEELEGEVDMRIVDYMAKVQEHFMNNPDAIDKLSQIIQNYKLSRKSVAGTSTTISTGRSNSSYFTTTPK